MTGAITLMNQLSAMQFELEGAGDGQLCDWEDYTAKQIRPQAAHGLCGQWRWFGGCRSRWWNRSALQHPVCF